MKRSLALIGLLLIVALSAFAAPSKMGFNLGGAADWSGAIPFVDMMKQSREFQSFTSNSWDSGAYAQFSKDSNGYPTQVPQTIGGQAHYVRKVIWADAIRPAGDYAFLYDGVGTFDFGGDLQVVSSSSGRIVLRRASSSAGTAWVDITSTSSSNPVRNFRLILPGHESTYLTQPLNPDYISKMGSASVLRFMDLMHANNNPVVQWSERTTPTWETQATSKGIAAEYVALIANSANKDAWITVPHLADDDYVRQLARTLRDNLNPNLKIYIEYSNEVWNYMFDQTMYGDSAGCADSYMRQLYPGHCYGPGRMYQIKRSADLFRIFREEFGGTNRLVNVLAHQAAGSWWGEQMLNHFYDSSLNPTQEHLDAIAIAPYFGGDAYNVLEQEGLTNAVPDGPSITRIITYANSSISGEVRDWIRSYATLARQHNLRLVAYEGGPHTVAVGALVENEILTRKLTAANRDPRMGMLLDKYFQTWFDEGGDSFLYFSFIDGWSRWGSWGALENQLQPISESPKYQAILRAQERYLVGNVTTVTCGNGVVESGESCDGTVSQTCQSLGFVSGTTRCRADCSGVDTSSCVSSTPCTLSSASWDATSAVEGSSVGLTVQGTGCDGRTLSVSVYEDDLTNDLQVGTLSGTFVNGRATLSWSAAWECDGSLSGVCTAGNPEYYFRATVESSTLQSSNQVAVTQPVSTPTTTECTQCLSPSLFWIGHSLVNNDMPSMVNSISTHKGLTYESQIINGAPLIWQWTHLGEREVDAKVQLATGNYNVLIMTEAQPIATHWQYNDPVTYATNFANILWAAKPTAHIYLYETWGDLSSTWEQTIVSDRTYWTQIADGVTQRTGKPVYILPAGAAMRELSQQIAAGTVPGVSSRDQLFSDSIHLTDLGNYFVALVHYSTVFKESPVGLSAQTFNRWGGAFQAPTDATARRLQEIAWQVVSAEPRSGVGLCDCGTQPTAVCGNGAVESSEACDGNSRTCTSNGQTGVQSCSSTCQFNTCVVADPVCGNGALESGETCDGGSRSCTVNGYTGTQSCTNTCNGYATCTTTQYCGDGTRNGNEQCDDGNTNSNDGCSPACQTENLCGNGVLNAGEVCDGNSQSCTSNGLTGTQSCASNCLAFNACITQSAAAVCGNSVVESGEVCDKNSIACTKNGKPGMKICTSTCTGYGSCVLTPGVCGNGIVESGEVCESSKPCTTKKGKGIRTCKNCTSYSTCQLGLNTTAVCGNGILEAGEACEGPASCTLNNVLGTKQCISCASYGSCVANVTSVCGNNVLETGEVCDGTQACTTSAGYTGTKSCSQCTTLGTCTSTQSCGDGIKNGLEQCDDGNSVSTDTCNACQTVTVAPTTSVSTANLVAYYPFDGNMQDASGNNHHGVNQGEVDCTVAGKIGNACKVGGTSDAIHVDPHPLDPLVPLGVSGANWVKPDSVSGGERILWEAAFHNFALKILNGYGYRCTVRNSAQHMFIAEESVPMSVGQWYHVACTFDRSTLRLYVDGIERKSLAVSGFDRFPHDTDSGMGIGCGIPGYCNEPGQWSSSAPLTIDDLRLYNRVLSATEISQLASQ